MNIVIPGRPVPAVRMTQSSKFVHKQAQRYLDYKVLVGWVAKNVLKTKVPTSAKASVAIQFYIHKGQTPDIDNLIKAILDGLNGIAWQDDKQVVKVIAERLEAGSKDCERAEIKIEAV